MTKIRKQRKAKKFRYGVNRKRLNKKMTRLPKIQCEPIQKSYEDKKTMIENLSEMGLSYDANKTIKLRPKKEVQEKIVTTNKWKVVQDLEAEVKEPREKLFKLPKSRVDWLCKLIDKHGFNYKKMSLDLKLNPFQETWKQLRAKIRQFQKIPSQWEPYVQSKMEVTAES